MMWQLQTLLDQLFQMILTTLATALQADPGLNVAFAILCLIGASGAGARTCAALAAILHLAMFLLA